MNFNVRQIPNFTNLSEIKAINWVKNPAPNINISTSSDTFQSNLPQRYASEYMISKLANSNSEIKNILKSANVPYKLNTDEINNVLHLHGSKTREIAVGIYDNLPLSIKQTVDKNSLKDAAYLHDIGKVFIPNEILNKASTLTNEEYSIMQLHPVLGYELLKNTNLNNKTLFLLKNHHQDMLKSGYPKVEKEFKADNDLQVLALADRYSALTEKRPYKDALSREQALTIINSEVKLGKFNPLIFNSLVNYTATADIANANGKNKNLLL